MGSSTQRQPPRREALRRPFVLAIVLTLLVAGLTGASGPAGAETHPGFSDVGPADPFAAEIAWMADAGYLEGYPDGTYGPALAVSRQALATVLWRMSGSPEGPFPTPPASDVAGDHPFFVAIAWAYGEGVLEGYADGTFRPGAPVSRQAMVAMLYRLADMHGRTYAMRFTDVPMGYQFESEIRWGGAIGLARGYGGWNTEFRATAPTSRQALAAWIHRFFDMTDGHWPVPAHDHHGHHCHAPITPGQQAAADQLVDDVTEHLENNLATVEDAIADGYILNAPPFGGAGAHWINLEYFTDGEILEPTKPESLMYAWDGTVEGAMFVMEHVGDAGPMIGGCLTQWHSHDNLCYDAPLREGGYVSWFTDWGTGCTGNTMLRITPEMLHVWVIDHPGGPFAGLET